MWICANRRLGFLIIRCDIAIHQQKPKRYQHQTASNRQDRIAFHASPLSNLEFCIVKPFFCSQKHPRGNYRALSDALAEFERIS
jgi:hypothetical protein